jgi:hypothetical protein
MREQHSLTHEQSFAVLRSEDVTADSGKWFYSEKERQLTQPSFHGMVTETHNAHKAVLPPCCMQFLPEIWKLSVF